jgi:hypothetical protein
VNTDGAGELLEVDVDAIGKLFELNMKFDEAGGLVDSNEVNELLEPDVNTDVAGGLLELEVDDDEGGVSS